MEEELRPEPVHSMTEFTLLTRGRISLSLCEQVSTWYGSDAHEDDGSGVGEKLSLLPFDYIGASCLRPSL